MEVKDAVRLAKDYVADLFAGEQITNVGLEEIEFSSNSWKVTIGFSRPWDHRSTLATRLTDRDTTRSYKVVHINDHSRQVTSVRDRFLETSQ